MMKCSVFLSIKWTPTFDSFSVNKPTACWSVVRCCQLYTDNVNTCEFVTSVVYVFKYVCMYVMSACIPTQKTIHSLPHWGIQYKCWIVYYNKEILNITVNEQHKKKIQVFLDTMTCKMSPVSCFLNCMTLKISPATYHNIPKDTSLQLFCRNWTS